MLFFLTTATNKILNNCYCALKSISKHNMPPSIILIKLFETTFYKT